MRLGGNLLAGISGSALTALAGVAATPFYLHFLGPAGYGLIGFLSLLLGVLSLLDFGLAPTLNREIARGVVSESMEPSRRLLHSLARLYLLTACLIGIVIAATSPLISRYWLHSSTLDRDSVTRSLMLIGLVIAIRWPAGLYLAAINGSQRLAVSSGITAAHALLGAAGAVLVLATVSPTIHAFFIWQAIAALAYSLTLRSAAWRAVGGRRGARFSTAEIVRVLRFSAGMSLIAIASVLFTQLDKALLSSMLGLEAFGVYMLAALISGGLYLISLPLFNALFPRFSALAAASDVTRLAELYTLATRFLAALVFPIGMIVAVFSESLMFVWTRNHDIAVQAAPLVTLLTAGTALHAVMAVPYALQLAYGRTSLCLKIIAVMIALLIPLTIFLTLTFAAVGAASAWLLLHIFYLLFGTWMTHRELLPGYAAHWLLRDVGLPLLLTCVVAVVGIGAGATRTAGLPQQALWAVSMLIAAVTLILAVSPQLRQAIRDNFGALKRASRHDHQ